MWKRRKLLIFLGPVAALVLAMAFLNRDTTPQYQGRSLSQWLMIHYESDRPNQNRAEGPLAASAIRAIGTNAIPLLLKWLRYETPFGLKTLSRALPVAIGNSRLARATLYRRHHQTEAARAAFRLLGTNAVSAIPELRSMTLAKSKPQTAGRAIVVLSYLGPQGFHAMEVALANTNQPFREVIVRCMAISTKYSVSTNTCLTPLRAAMNDPDPRLRATASNMVFYLRGEQTTGSPHE